MDFLGTIFKTISNSLKAGVNVTVDTGFTYALAHDDDDILVKDGKEAYFEPKTAVA